MDDNDWVRERTCVSVTRHSGSRSQRSVVIGCSAKKEVGLHFVSRGNGGNGGNGGKWWIVEVDCGSGLWKWNNNGIVLLYVTLYTRLHRSPYPHLYRCQLGHSSLQLGNRPQLQLQFLLLTVQPVKLAVSHFQVTRVMDKGPYTYSSSFSLRSQSKSVNT